MVTPLGRGTVFLGCTNPCSQEPHVKMGKPSASSALAGVGLSGHWLLTWPNFPHPKHGRFSGGMIGLLHRGLVCSVLPQLLHRGVF